MTGVLKEIRIANQISSSNDVKSGAIYVKVSLNTLELLFEFVICHYFWLYEKILILPDCVEHETDFAGNDINAHRNDTDYARGAGRRNSIGQCRDLCQSRDGCNYFTYNKRFRHCYLKTSDSGRRSFTRYSGVSSGTKFCGKMNCKDFCNGRIFITIA